VKNKAASSGFFLGAIVDGGVIHLSGPEILFSFVKEIIAFTSTGVY